jgi:phosphate:Na+ symporter
MPTEQLNIANILFGLFGGLAIFIYGMNLMSDGLQKAAGERMRTILGMLTGRPLLGVAVGALVTTIVQSSSATTVMVVGFVSAGLMTLPQAISVIMGANIGTTITAQLIAFKIGNLAYPIVAIGFVFYFFSKKKSIKYFGQTVFSFGLLFVGLNLMGDVMTPLAKSPVFANMILKLSKRPILGVLTGTLMTVVVQSSSATIAVLQNLASQYGPDGKNALISLTTALPILFGDNIGTTITALFATIGAKISAKRAAVAHSLFNIIGTFVFIWFIPLFAKFVEFISPKGPTVEVISRQIANAHTSFNLLNTLIWLPFTWLLAKMATFLVRGKEEVIENRIMYLDDRMLRNPALAMGLAIKELSRMALMSQKMMSSAKNAFVNSNIEDVKVVMELEDTVDMLQREIVRYLSAMVSKGTVTEKQSVKLAGLMHVTNDIERMADRCRNIAQFARIKHDEHVPFSDEALAEITDAFNKVNEMVDDSIVALHDGNLELSKKISLMEVQIDDLENKLRDKHIERLNKGLCNPKSAIIFIELIHNLERIADHCNNIAEAVMADHGFKSDDKETKNARDIQES